MIISVAGPFMIKTIAARRLHNLRLSGSLAGSITDIVESFGAMQAQEYSSAKWALGLRVPGISESDVDRAFDRGDLLRTHVMRPTWHFVTPSMIRWLLELTAPRVHASSASRYRDLGLDTATRKRSVTVLRRSLRGGRHLTRAELSSVLRRSGISTDGQRLPYLLINAELDAVVCSGPRRGKQFTYALFEERVPPGRSLSADEALETLAHRYFTTHGPATARDFAWWSGLTVGTARTAIEMLDGMLESETIGGLTYWSDGAAAARLSSSAVHLLPAYDEYVVAYRDRDAVPYRSSSMPDAFGNPLVIEGEVVGSWRKRLATGRAVVEAAIRRPTTKAASRALRGATAQYAAFLGVPVTLA